MNNHHVQPTLARLPRSTFLTGDEAAACRRILGVVLESERATDRALELEDFAAIDFAHEQTRI